MTSLSASARTRIERYDTIVIGAGQAGLAAGYHLARRDADFLMLESATRIGEPWRSRWDSLRVFTSAAFTSLPGMRFPAPPSYRPHKDELADYFERYAEHFDLPIRFNTTVTRVVREAGRYALETDAVRYLARNVIVATGIGQSPHVPTLARQLSGDIRQLHSTDYRNPFALPEGPVLVVGVGNAGARIALEIARFRPTLLAGDRRRHWPARVLGRDIHWWLWPLLSRVSASSRLGRVLRARMTSDPLVGVSERALQKAGVVRVGRITDVQNGRPEANRRTLDVRTIIWCTGFAPNFSWIELPLTYDGGTPRTHRGAVPGAPGLFLLGQRYQHTLASSLIGGVGDDAAHVVDQICGGDGLTRSLL